MKYILVIGDGMADNALPQLGGKTPLEYANIPAMDAMAGAGTVGTALTVPEGVAAGSDTAILSIFGANPAKVYGGRASLEAAAGGIFLRDDEVAYRCNMITIEDGKKSFESKRILSHSAGSVDGDISDTLITELFESPRFKKAATAAGMRIYPAGSFRHLAVQRFEGSAQEHKLQNLHLQELCLVPPHDHIGKEVGDLLPVVKESPEPSTEASETHDKQSKKEITELAETLTGLMRIAHEILDRHELNVKLRKEGKMPANGIWLWAHGSATKLPQFAERYGKSGCVISAVPLCQGIGTLMGLKKITVPGATGMLHTNYEGKVEAALEALKTHDFVTIHIEAPDECSHDGDLDGKLQAIEWIDSRVLSPLETRLRDEAVDFRILVMSDHKTLISTRGHDGSPVPFLLCDSRVDRKTTNNFSERYAEKGRYIDDATHLMGMLFDDECESESKSVR